MKTTFNRRLVLEALSEDFDGMPPHSASTVHYYLDLAFKNKWEGIYSDMTTCPNMQQVHRTLKDLWHSGLIVGSRIKQDHYNNNLPQWVVHYQLSKDIYHNWLLTECDRVFNKVKKAKFGFNFFGSIMDMGLPVDDIEPLKLQVKTLMQKTHPDKMAGYEEPFKQMGQCLEWIKDGIPLPTPTHSQNSLKSKNNLITAGKNRHG